MKKIILITILILGLTIRALHADGPPAIQTPEAGVSGGAMPFLGESFQTDLATGAATLSIPITVPPGRKNMQPKLGLSYSSNNSNGICGMGWSIPISAIQRSTKYGVPKYTNDDIFMAAGSNAELVNVAPNEYRAKIESAFMKYVFQNNTWTVYDKAGTKYIFGPNPGSRLESGTNTFAWYLDEVIDVYGNYIEYIYEKHTDGQIYLKEIKYTGFKGQAPLTPDKSIIFNYIENRSDKLQSYRSGWKITTSRLLSSIEVKLNGSRVWLYELDYITSGDTDRALLHKITVKDKSDTAFPPKTFTYQKLE